MGYAETWGRNAILPRFFGVMLAIGALALLARYTAVLALAVSQVSGTPLFVTEALQAVIDRCRSEMLEEQKEAPHRSEPLRALLHGVPGAGKSETLHWLRQYFEA